MLLEEELRNKLCDNLNIHQHMYLEQHKHNWFEENYLRTIATIALGEQQMIDLMDKSKENAKFAKTGRKRKSKTYALSGGNTNKKKKCQHCHKKYHKNEC